MIALLLGLALGQQCEVDVAPVPDRLSVAWVSPVGAKARSGTSLWLVPTADLADWVARNEPTTGDLLRHLGQRRRKSEPRRAYKVVVFDADRELLCRPVEDEEPGLVIEGVPVCEAARSRRTRAHDGCGRTRPRDGGESHMLFRARWRDIAADGFCVLPATRFVEEAGRP